ncbi:MAG: 30S ribosomal protein S16 [Sphaerochaetaceae bacterium]
MSTSMRLTRMGTQKKAEYRIVVMDSHAPTNSKTLDVIGHYHPRAEEDKQIVLDAEKAKAWLVKGSQPSATVKMILNKSGIHISRKPAQD